MDKSIGLKRLNPVVIMWYFSAKRQRFLENKVWHGECIQRKKIEHSRKELCAEESQLGSCSIPVKNQALLIFVKKINDMR